MLEIMGILSYDVIPYDCFKNICNGIEYIETSENECKCGSVMASLKFACLVGGITYTKMV